MNLAFKGLLAVLWLLVIPSAAGILFLRKKTDYTLGECFFTGYLFLFTAAEVLTLPMIYLRLPLHVLVWCFGAVAAAAALLGLFHFRRSLRSCISSLCSGLRGTSIFFWYAVILILMQICVVALYAHFDADDAFYVATATTSVETDSIFVVNAYTGINYRNIPRRYVLSPFPIFLAVVSQLCGGLHPSIMAHTIFPPVFLILTYTVLYYIGRKWFREDSRGRGIFLFLTAVLSSFTYYSAYNSGNFQMIRIWQGKALLAAALIPLVFYLCLSIAMEEKPEYSWLMLLLANIACCHVSSMGIMLAPLVQGIFILLGLIRYRSLKRAALGLACCIPSLILGVFYVFLV